MEPNLVGGTDLRIRIPTVLIFFAVLVSVPGFVFLARARANQRIRERLHDVVADPRDEGISTTILRDVELSSIPFLNRMLKSANWARRLELLDDCFAGGHDFRRVFQLRRFNWQAQDFAARSVGP